MAWRRLSHNSGYQHNNKRGMEAAGGGGVGVLNKTPDKPGRWCGNNKCIIRQS